VTAILVVPAGLIVGSLATGTVLILGTDEVAQLALALAFCVLLVVVTVTDLERRLIPNIVLGVGAAAAVAIAALGVPGSLGARGIAAAAAGGALFPFALLRPGGMGMGDAKLAAVMGLYLGRSVAPGLLIAFGAGALVGLAMIARGGAAARKQAVPFGPFLALGGIVALWYGNALVEWYLATFFNG
jgi:leader peptidase (prepilin peptidase)/N-methyltransferase